MRAGVFTISETANAIGLFHFFGMPFGVSGFFCLFRSFLVKIYKSLIVAPIVKFKAIIISHIQPPKIEKRIGKGPWGSCPSSGHLNIGAGHSNQLALLPLAGTESPQSQKAQEAISAEL